MKPYYEHGGIVIYHGDCREVLPIIDAADAVVTDPPYVFGIQSTTGKTGWGDIMNSAIFYETWLRQARRICRDLTGSCWVFNSWRSFPILARASFNIEWNIESLAVWDKEWIGPGGTRGLRPSYELVALYCAAGFSVKNRGLADVFRHKWMATLGSTGHRAEKPLGLLSKIIRESGAADVLDPFMGSGTTLAAARSLGLPAIGIEIEERYCEMAAKRLEQEVFDFSEDAA